MQLFQFINLKRNIMDSIFDTQIGRFETRQYKKQQIGLNSIEKKDWDIFII